MGEFSGYTNQANDFLPVPIVDFHVHLFPDAFFDAVWKAFVREYGWDVVYQIYTSEIIAFLRNHGVVRFVFSNLSLNVPHLGEFECREFLELLDAHLKLYLDTASFAFFMDGTREEVLGGEEIVRHQDMILYGFDFPNLVFPWEKEIMAIRNLGLPDEVSRKVFYLNGVNLLEELCAFD